MTKKLWVLIAVSLVVLGGGIVGATIVSISKTKQESLNLFGKEETKVIYSSSDSSLDTGNIKTIDYGDTKKVSQKQTVQNKNKIYLSPNKKYIAINYSVNETETLTRITDLEGNTISGPELGYFVSWSADSSKVVLFLSDVVSPNGKRMIYYLGVNGEYGDSGLPEGSTSADVSIDGDVVYNLTDTYTDRSNIHVRNVNGKDYILVKGSNNIFAWVRWSPDGEKVAFLKTDLSASADNQTIWIANKDGSGAEELSKVTWGYPAVWSPDNSKLAFSYRSNIFEYDLKNKIVVKKTNFNDGLAQYPNYSTDGQTIVFTLDDGTGKQLWSVRDGSIEKITTSGENTYPNLAQ